ncbi:MAG: efflux RND transporter periplasmic adaptor subunit [Dehalococcoidia bacterium]|nr:efflux RND transporter periplasmic adaptor subunit [Dehalococcoidia bacterium]
MISKTWSVRAPLFVVITLIGMVACSGTSTPAPQSSAPTQGSAARGTSVRVVQASMGIVRVSTAYAAQVQAKDAVNVAPNAAGRVERVLVDVGSEVKRGQLLAELNHTALDVQLRSAEAGFRLAQSRVGTTAEEQQRAQAAVEAAKAKLAQLRKPSISDIQVAESALAAAKTTLESAQIKLRQLQTPAQADVSAQQAAISAANSTLLTAQAALTAALSTVSRGAPSSQISQAYTTLASLRTLAGSHINDLNNPELRLGRPPSAEEKAVQQAIVDKTQQQVNLIWPQLYTALAEQQVLLDIGVRTALSTELSAQASVDSAQAKLNDLLRPSADKVTDAKNSVASTQAAYDSAVAKLSALKNPSPSDIAMAESVVVAAEQGLSGSRAQVDQAQAAVDLVKQQIEDTKVVAPFEGIVSQRLLSPGAFASTQTPIVSIVSKDVVATIRVEEAAINSVKTGLLVNLTSPSLPGQTIAMRVSAIAPSGDDRAHTFLVQLTPDSAVPGLRPGASANATVITSHENVVAVPREAVFRKGGQSQDLVAVVLNGKVSVRQVQAGLIDDRNAEIVSGVKAGEQVVITGQASLNDGDAVVVDALSQLRSGDVTSGQTQP